MNNQILKILLKMYRDSIMLSDFESSAIHYYLNALSGQELDYYAKIINAFY